VAVGPGDDAAVVGDGWVLSTDLSVEGVHFRREWITDEEIGFRAATAALSDLAAMAAEPVGLLVSMAYLPGGAVDAEAVQRGVQAAAAAVGASILGGDVSRSPGPLVLDVTVVGWTAAPVLRSGANPGDALWVTGCLGRSAAAVSLWRAGGTPAPRLRSAFARPTARVAVARALAGSGVPTAMVDLSDGLAGDAGHLAAAGGVRVIVETARLPVDAPDEATPGSPTPLDAALHGGEDYELLFTAAPGAVEAWLQAAEPGVALTRIGHVEAGEGVWAATADGSLAPLSGGFDHLGASP
jgi:thiamine-monophosphate kinase